MPGSMASDPAAFLRGAGGVMPPQGGMMTGDGGGGPQGPAGPGGAGPDGGGAPAGVPPELAQMQLAQALLPQLLAQQQGDYYKKFLKQVGVVLREFIRARGISPKVISQVSRSITGLEAAAHAIDKERPQDAAPVESLLAATTMQNRPPMGGSAVPAGLPVMR